MVSTIHKAKGREFDDVYMLLTDNYAKNAELMHRYYVGITRAKNRLFIHTNGHCFDRQTVDRRSRDDRSYTLPEEIVLQLTFRDVYLEFFKGIKREVLALQSGDPLQYRDFTLYTEKTDLPVAKLSTRMQKTLTDWFAKGYRVKSATVSFIVAWKPKDTPKEEPETAVLLANLTLTL